MARTRPIWRRLHRRIDLQRLDRRGLAGGEAVHADHDAVAAVDLLLRAIGRVLDLALDQARLDGRQRAAGRLDPLDQLHRRSLDPIRGLLDRVGAAHGIDGVRDAAFRGDDLLRSERDAGGFLGRQRQRLVAAVAVERLRPAEHGCQRLERHADDVVVGLLGGERAAGGLRVEAQLLRARLGRAEPIAHEPRPQPPRGTELRDLLEKVVVRVEEERQPLAEAIDVESGVERRLHVGQRIRERERRLPGLPSSPLRECDTR